MDKEDTQKHFLENISTNVDNITNPGLHIK